MNYFLSFLGGVVGAVIGFIALAAVAGMLGGAGINGGRAMVVVFVVGPIGGVVGFLVGIWLVLRARGLRSFGAFAGHAGLSAAAIAVLVGVGMGMISSSDDILRPTLQLEFEIRLPPGAPIPARLSTIKVDLQTDKNTMPSTLDPEQMRIDGDRTVLVGSVDLYFRTSSRVLVLQVPGQPEQIFQLPLLSTPHFSEELSPWARVDLVAENPQRQPRKAGPGDDIEIRYRVPDPSKPKPRIEFEIRLPEGTPMPPEISHVYTAQRRDTGEEKAYFLYSERHRLDGNRPVLVGGMRVRFPDRHPKFVIRLPGGAGRVFDLRYPQDQTPTPAFGPWMPAEAIEDEGQPPRAPGADDGYEMRYQIGVR